jgi:hypothetical protein
MRQYAGLALVTAGSCATGAAERNKTEKITSPAIPPRKIFYFIKILTAH